MVSNVCVCCRIAQVDKSQPTCQPSRFLICDFLICDDIRTISNYAYQPFTIPIIFQFMAVKEALRGSITLVYWTVHRTSITIVLKHTTVYYVAVMNYRPSSCIYVTFKHFLVELSQALNVISRNRLAKRTFMQGYFLPTILFIFHLLSSK
jgi:hypothetical protein